MVEPLSKSGTMRHFLKQNWISFTNLTNFTKLNISVNIADALEVGIGGI